MSLHIGLAWLHLLALGAGLGAIWSRARGLRDAGPSADPGEHRRSDSTLAATAWWTLALGTWIVTGGWLLFSSGATARAAYLGDRVFLLKIALVLGVIALEAWPLTTLLRWRASDGRRDPRDAGRIEVISYLQCALLVGVVLASSGRAHVGSQPAPTASDEQPAAADSATVAGSGDSSAVVAADDLPAIPPMEPSGMESVTAADLALLAGAIAMPLDGIDPLTLRSSFDELRGGGTREHRALDIMAPRGTPVRSAARGRVLKLFTSVAGGLMVYAADSSERFILMYAHLDGYAPGLRDGAVLARGQVIGRVGSTGNASPSAPHLHLAISRSADVRQWSRGTPIDPLPVLQAAARRR